MKLDAHSRAVYVLALHAIRSHILNGEDPSREGVYIHAQLTWFLNGQRVHYPETRRGRALCALWLRAVLRADVGDFGPMAAEPPWHPASGVEREMLVARGRTTAAFWFRVEGELVCTGCGRPQAHARLPVRPLWQSIPARPR